MKKPITALAAVVALATLPGAAFADLAIHAGAVSGDDKFLGDTALAVGHQHNF